MLGDIVTIWIVPVMSAFVISGHSRRVASRNLLEHDPDGDADPQNCRGENHQKSIDVECHGASLSRDQHNAPVRTNRLGNLGLVRLWWRPGMTVNALLRAGPK